MEEQENVTDREAAGWVVRLDNEPDNAELRAECDAWVGADSRRRGAFLRAQAAWQTMDRLQILTTEAAITPSNHFSRRNLLIAGGAATALAASAAGIVLWPRGVIATPIGEIRRVPLADGSLLNVNTNTSLRVALKGNAREIDVDRGEAWFEVAKDKSRPFVVSAGPVRVRAVGTAFAVRRHQSGADVLVTEGTVEVWSVDDEARKARLAAGSKVFVSNDFGPVQVVSAGPEIERVLAWRNGEIALGGQTLAQAAEEFNRYNQRKLVIDPALASQEFDGWFRTNDPQSFAESAAKAMGASVSIDGDEIRLSRH